MLPARLWLWERGRAELQGSRTAGKRLCHCRGGCCHCGGHDTWAQQPEAAGAFPGSSEGWDFGLMLVLKWDPLSLLTAPRPPWTLLYCPSHSCPAWAGGRTCTHKVLNTHSQLLSTLGPEAAAALGSSSPL